MKKAWAVILCATLIAAMVPCAALAESTSTSGFLVASGASGIAQRASEASSSSSASPSSKAPEVKLTGPSSQAAAFGSAMEDAAFTLTGYQNDCTWECVPKESSGQFPDGIKIEKVGNFSAKISGTPTVYGFFNLTVNVLGGGGVVASVPFQLAVARANVNNTNVVDLGTITPHSSSYTVQGSCLVNNISNTSFRMNKKFSIGELSFQSSQINIFP